MAPEQRQDEADLDPGAYIGREPELESETIPGGVQPGDERVAAYQSRTAQVLRPAGSPAPDVASEDDQDTNDLDSLTGTGAPD